MFLSTYPLKLDEKGRFFLPSKWRADLAEGLVIVQGHDDCLAIYTEADFAAISERTGKKDSTLAEVRAYQRMLAADASESKPDKQGRVTVPAQLRAYAGLDRDILVTGAVDHGEIWNPETWQRYRDAEQDVYNHINKVIGQDPGGDR